MTIYHSAYTFDIHKFHADLEKAVVVNGKLRLDLLHEKATAVARNASEDLQRILSHMRYGEYWLDASEGESDLWYLVCLASALKPAPALSFNRFRRSYYVMRVILPVAGWSDEESAELIGGRPISLFLQSYGNELFLKEFISAFGGFLYFDDVRRILQHLHDSKGFFTSSSEESINAIAEFAGYNSREPAALLEMAFADASDMLQTAIDRHEDMFLLLD